MRDLPAFRTAVTQQRRGCGHTQRELARAIGLSEHALSRKLNGKDAVLSLRDAVAIVSALADWGALASGPDVERLLGLLDIPLHAVPDHLWERGPLARLRPEPAVVVPRPPRVRPEPVPAPINALVGRAEDLRLLHTALAESRLVTLVGVGGTGKTRLATECALRSAADYADGAAFADLSGVHDVTLAAVVLARALGLSPSSVAAAERELAAALKGLELLVVVDNVEQLPGIGAILARVLAAAPRVRMVVTSRVRLRVDGEHVVRVPPLALPPAAASPAEMQAAEAVQMFARRAAAAGAPINEADLPAVARICVAVDGLPLALELAAARVATYRPTELAARLERRLDLLSDGSADRPDRQRALRATLDWSVALLSAPAAQLCTELGVLAGRFDVPAAAGIAGAGRAAPEVGALLAELVEHSLLISHPGTPGGFQLMQVVREYALEKLTQNGTLELTQRRHLRYWTAQAQQARARLQAGLAVAEYGATLARLADGYPDMLAGLEFATQAGADDVEVVETAAQLCIAAAPSWVRGPSPAEGMHLLDRLVRTPAWGRIPSATRAAALQAAALLAWVTGDLRRAEQLANEALGIVAPLGDQLGMARALRVLGEVRMYQDDAVAAEELFRRELAAAERAGNIEATAHAHNLIADAMRVQGRYAEARAAARRSLSLANRLRDPLLVGFVTCTLADVARDAGEYPRARRLLAAALRRNQAYNSVRGMVDNLEGLAATLGLAGEAGPEVVTLLAAADRLRERSATPRPAGVGRLLERALRPVVERVPAAARTVAEAQGWNAALEDIVALALRLAQPEAAGTAVPGV